MKTRNFVSESEIRLAKQMDVLTYLQRYEPHELVREGNGYCTKSHDSLKISNGMWHWFSRGIGGRTALDYLIHVKGMDFVPAVQLLCGNAVLLPPVPPVEKKEAKPFELPPQYPDESRVVQYLMGRGIAYEVIARCIDGGILYESDRYHNAVFVGKDADGIPRYAMQRSTGQRALKLETSGSDKRYSFHMAGTGNTLLVSESAIDALSIATIMLESGKRWQNYHYLSLGGVSVKKDNGELPLALSQYLSEHPGIAGIRLMLDNDEAGKNASESIVRKLAVTYDVKAVFPKHGKDFNEEIQHRNRQRNVRESVSR